MNETILRLQSFLKKVDIATINMPVGLYVSTEYVYVTYSLSSPHPFKTLEAAIEHIDFEIYRLFYENNLQDE